MGKVSRRGVLTLNYQSTKFLQTNFVIVFVAIALAMKWIDGLSYASITGVALANYAYHDVKQKGIKNAD